MLRTLDVSCAFLAGLASTAWAAPTVNIGNYFGTVGQNIVVTVTANFDPGESIAGMDFVFGTGPFAATPGNPTGDGPKIIAVDIIGPGTIFNGNNSGQANATPPGPAARKVKATTTTADANNAPVTSGTIALVTLATAGLAPQHYQLRVTQMGSLGGGPEMKFVKVDPLTTVVPNAAFGDLELIIPEPSSIVFGLFALAVLTAATVRKGFGGRT